MSRTILLVTWDGAGNIPPELELCRALVAEGYRVFVFTHDSLRNRVEQVGAVFLPIENAGQIDARDRMPEDERIQQLLDGALLSEGHLAELNDTLAELAPDAVIVDSMMLLPLALARQRGIPCIAFHHTLASYIFGGQFEQITEFLQDPFNAILEKHGLTGYEKPIHALHEADVILTATYREFDSAGAGARLIHIGPLRPHTGSAAKIERRDPEKPLVVVSLSTSFMDQIDLLQRLTDALAILDVEGLVTTGPSIAPSELVLPDNVRAVEYVPHEQVLHKARLLVTHAGHGTILAGISFGVPMLCIPMGRDQESVAGRAKELGLARVAEANAPVNQLHEALTILLHDEAMLTRSKEFAERVTEHPGVELGIETVKELMIS